jgi:O-antigen/teichoic acid export membrane protein
MKDKKNIKGNSFLKHFLIIGGGSFINLLIGLITTPLITRIVDPAEYGQLSIFTMYSNIATMVLCLGLDQALVRFYYEKNEFQYKQSLFWKCIVLPVVFTLIFDIIIVFLSISNIIKFEFNSFIMVLMAVYTLSQVIYRFSILILRLEYKSKKYSLLSILLKSSYVLFAVALIMIIKKDYLLLLTTATVASSIICLILSIIMQAKMWDFFRINKDACMIRTKELVKYAYPYIISMGLGYLFQAIDKIALNYYCSYEEVGIYSSAMSLIHVFSIVQTTFNTLWTPMAMEQYVKDKNDKSFYIKGNQIITFIMFFIGICLILFKDVFAILLGKKYREAAYIIPFLTFYPIMYTISETTVNGLVFMKKSKMQVVVALVSCIVNIIGNIVLVPILGCQGAAISTGISYIVFFFLRTFLSNKYYYVNFRLIKIYTIIAATFLYALYNTFVKFDFGSIIGFLFCMFLLFILYRESVIFIINYIKERIRKKV